MKDCKRDERLERVTNRYIALRKMIMEASHNKKFNFEVMKALAKEIYDDECDLIDMLEDLESAKESGEIHVPEFMLSK